jgi:hypothetical protein
MCGGVIQFHGGIFSDVITAVNRISSIIEI